MTTLISIDQDDFRRIIREELHREPRLYTIPEAAERMAIGAGTLRTWIAARSFPCIALSGGAVRIAEEDIERFIREHRREVI